MPPSVPKPFNLNSALALATLASLVFTGVFFFAPLKTLPDDVRAVRSEVIDVQRVQAVQTEALKTLAEVARETQSLRNDFERSEGERRAIMTRQDEAIRKIEGRLDSVQGR